MSKITDLLEPWVNCKVRPAQFSQPPPERFLNKSSWLLNNLFHALLLANLSRLLSSFFSHRSKDHQKLNYKFKTFLATPYFNNKISEKNHHFKPQRSRFSKFKDNCPTARSISFQIWNLIFFWWGQCSGWALPTAPDHSCTFQSLLNRFHNRKWTSHTPLSAQPLHNFSDLKTNAIAVKGAAEAAAAAFPRNFNFEFF